MSNEAQDVKAFTAVEMAYVKAVIRYSRVNLTTADWEKVAEEVRVKDAKCARERFRQISVKHSFGSGDSPQKPSAGGSPCKVTKRKGVRAKKLKKEEAEAEAEAEPETPPVKVEAGSEDMVSSEI